MSKTQLAFEALFAIERGLRSTIRTDQKKAIDSLPEFLITYPQEQEVLQSLVLRLLDYFKGITANDRRLDLISFLENDDCCVYFKNLKIGGEEFSRRLIPLWEVNDTLTKVMVLRWFAILHPVLYELPEVLYRLHLSLASENREELVYAIRVLQVFTQQSGKLPGSLVDSILFQIDRLSMTSKLTLDLTLVLNSVELDPESTFVIWQYFSIKDIPEGPLKNIIAEILQNVDLFT